MASTLLFIAGVATGWVMGGGYSKLKISIQNKKFLQDKSEEEVARAHVELGILSTLSVISQMRPKLTDDEQEYLEIAESGMGKLLTYYAINRMSILKDISDAE